MISEQWGHFSFFALRDKTWIENMESKLNNTFLNSGFLKTFWKKTPLISTR